MLDPKNIGPGEEQHEYFKDSIIKKQRCQYDYRDNGGTLFSCVRPDLDACRKARNDWLDARKARKGVIA